MAGINTTLGVFTIGNSSLNAKFESLESKLCGKILTMKLYFIDELPPLKNEASINKKKAGLQYQHRRNNYPENKIKLLELENKLLKHDVTNKQKLIDTILKHNSKLSQNFDVSLISPFTYKARKQPPERSITRKMIPS